MRARCAARVENRRGLWMRKMQVCRLCPCSAGACVRPACDAPSCARRRSCSLLQNKASQTVMPAETSQHVETLQVPRRLLVRPGEAVLITA